MWKAARGAAADTDTVKTTANKHKNKPGQHLQSRYLKNISYRETDVFIRPESELSGFSPLLLALASCVQREKKLTRKKVFHMTDL